MEARVRVATRAETTLRRVQRPNKFERARLIRDRGVELP